MLTDVLADAEAAMARLTDLDLTGASGDDLRATVCWIASASVRLDAVRARAVTAAEQGGAAMEAGAVDGARWLSAVTGATPHMAGRSQTLGRAMEAVPTLASSVNAGKVDGEQAATLAGAVARGVLDEDAVSELVTEARSLPAGALSRETKRREAQADQTAMRRDEAHARQRRRARWWVNDDGTVQGDFHLDALSGQPVIEALNAFTLPDAADTPDTLRRTPQQRRADGLSELARRTLDRGEAGTVRSVRPHVTVVVPAAILAADLDDAEDADATGLLGGETVISAALARQIMCDATVRRIVLDPDGRPLDVGRATRTWSGAQRAASRAIDGGCRGPACRKPFDWTDLHHIIWWRDGGTTGIDNALPLCGVCHDLVHHGDWTVVLDPTTRAAVWTSPGGQTVTNQPRGPAALRP